MILFKFPCPYFLLISQHFVLLAAEWLRLAKPVSDIYHKVYVGVVLYGLLFTGARRHRAETVRSVLLNSRCPH